MTIDPAFKGHNSTMQPEPLPLFPLQVVLFPRTPLPLHIFEERYKEMIGMAIRNGTEFGVVLANDKGIVNTGCTAVVERVMERHADGKIDLLSAGRRRFEIESLDQEKPYLRAVVQFFDDEIGDRPPPDELRMQVLEAYDSLRSSGGTTGWEPSLQDPQLSFQLGQAISDLNFRQRLLSTRSETERMKLLAEFLPLYASRIRHIVHIKAVAPHNGHSKHVGFE
jgi:Lon protease-like protein